MLLFVLLILTVLVLAAAMPYNVPLQGLVGGKRTLVLLDDLVIFMIEFRVLGN